jgi:hypothetical protein
MDSGRAKRTPGRIPNRQPSSRASGFQRCKSEARAIGAEVHAWKLRIAPQLRYLRWERDGLHVILRTVPDQAQFLVGISF